MKPARCAAMRLYRKIPVALAVAAALAGCGSSPAQPRAATDLERGRLLYENTCDTCHTTQPHWREQRLVKTWPDLLAQVERWQGIARAGWTPGEIQDVASYLNATFYHLPCDACGGPRADLKRY